MSCTWPVDRSCLPNAVGELDQQQQQNAEDLAVQVLWALSGRQFGICPIIARPCRQSCGDTYSGLYSSSFASSLLLYWDGSNWRNTLCGCGPKCSWVSPNVVHLASGVGLPVVSVEEVRIEGVVLDPSEYRLEGDLLYRIGASWPNQDLTQPLDEPGTWSVTYMRGVAPPPGTAKLVGVLALEFLNACTGGKCRLPRRVQSMTRQGVSYEMVDTTALLEAGKTGIPEIDMWLMAVNPHRVQEPVRVR